MSDITIEQLIEKIEQYGRNRFELYKLKILRLFIELLTSFVTNAAFIGIFSFVILMLSIGLALFLGELTGRLSYGFFMLAGFYLLVFIACRFLLYKCLKVPLANLIIRKYAGKYNIWKKKTSSEIYK